MHAFHATAAPAASRTSWRRRVTGFLFLAAAVLLALGLLPAHAAVPNKNAEPAYAEEQTILQAQKDARAPEPGFASAASGQVHIDRHYLGQYGSTEGTVIVQRGGNTWRTWRNGPLATISGAILVVALLVIFALYQTVGPQRTGQPDTGRRIQRFSSWERGVHWATAISFIILAVTGLVILFGKKLLIPLFGHDVFSFIAYVFKYLHNFIGPLFIVCSTLMFITFARRNIPRRSDWEWAKRGGGLFTHQHVPAGFFNAGEKSWFWFGVSFLGIIMSVTGLVLDFVTFGQTRYILQVANYLHLGAATLYIALAMGHIYLGTWGTPGAYEAMRHGSVDESWAKAHHSLWYEEVKAGLPPGTLEDRPPPPDTPAGGRPPGSVPPGTRPGPAH